MSLRDVLAKAFSGRTAPRGTLGSLLDEAKRLAGAGSRRAFAAAVGIGESTLRLWEKGLKTAKGQARARQRMEVGVRRLSVRQDAPPDRITATIANPGTGPATRTVNVDPGGVERARDLWAAGDDKGAVREFRAAITDDWYRERLFRPQDPDDGHDDVDSQEFPDVDDTSEPIVGGVSW